MRWTMERSGDGKWITLAGPDYGQIIEVHNDDVVDDQTSLAEKIVRFLNGPTDEDVERVAEILKRADLDSQSVDYGDPVNYYRHLARAALDAFLKGSA